jgi:hypothetical protein
MLLHKRTKFHTSTILLLLNIITVVGSIESKRGLILSDPPSDQTDLATFFSSPLLGWMYNYSPQPPTTGQSKHPFTDLSFIPMLWGANGPNTFFSALKTGPQYNYVLGFNEPDMSIDVGGSDISVAEAVSIWQTQIQPLKNLGYKLGSPAGRLSSLTH